MIVPSTATDDALLDNLQRAAFSYFVDHGNPENGLVADTSRPDAPASIAVVGFALACFPVGVERGWISRADARSRSLAALRFFRDAPRGEGPDTTGYKGFYYHFLDMRTGLRVWRSELSMIDTAFLIAGALVGARYFDRDEPAEVELRAIVDELYRRVDWRWAQNGGRTLRQGWKPECGFLHYGWEGYSEAILLYLLALGSPTQPIEADAYRAWTATYQWENLYGHDVLYAGPLFVHQFSARLGRFPRDPRPFMREKRSDYFENSRRATYIQSAYALRNPHGFTGYGRHSWGLSAGDGPSDEDPAVQNEPRQLFGYAGRGVPYGPDDGTLSVWASLASLPFAPELVLPTIREMLTAVPAGPHATDASSAGSTRRSAGCPAGTYGLDQGIVAMMIENHRTGRIWEWMQGCEPLVLGLRRAGFDGGWL